MPTTLTLQDMRDDVAAILEIDAAAVSDDDNLVDVGLDSIRLMQLASQWAGRGVTLPFSALAERPQLSYWWALVLEGCPDGTAT